MDVLDLAQIENNTFKLNKAFFSLTGAVEQAFSIVKHAAQRKNLELLVSEINEEDLKYLCNIYGDKSRLIQVIVNFLSNSIKFSNQDSKIVVSIRILQK